VTNDEWGSRMKSYELPTRQVLPPRTYTIIRVDGRAFHTYLRKAVRPFDPYVIASMDTAAVALCEEISGARFAYTQSDEISILLTDLEPRTEPWFGGVVQKMASIAASVTSGAFTDSYRALQQPTRLAAYNKPAVFDARVYTIPSRIEVANYFRWRQADAIRNAVSMAAHALFRSHEVHGLNTAQIQEFLFQREGINFKTDYTDRERRGGVAVREGYTIKRANVQNLVDRAYGRTDRKELPIEVQRSRWIAKSAPDFTLDNRGFLAENIPQEPADALQASTPGCTHEAWETWPFGDGVPYICADCKHVFTVAEVAERQGDQR